ncbi:MAG: hypothetical protein GEV07_05285 [Streptosporangiales bacterium]|nr:hypothetical protein [Streptosporangiales bacterium]
MTHVSINVHVAAGEPRQVTTFDADGNGAPFVALQVGSDFGGVTLMVRDEQALNDLASMVAEARTGLAGAINRATRAKQQSELPDLVAS